ncbi:hypothetical protein B0H13DRAFT_1973864 [Mycena leptocephala]|nr:hypothetical protein B0H13DRAFT_1973864 [Mycena leptocephala]
MWSLEQVAEHNSPQSCWVIIQNSVYDVTDFLQEHPGGAKIILKYAGRDATSAYEPIHPPDALERTFHPLQQRPPLVRIMSLGDMEEVARKVLSHKAEAYYSSAAETTSNARAFSRFFFHPRVMRPVGKCDPSTTILGFDAATTTKIIQMVSSNASMSPAEIIAAAPPSQPLFFQLYKNTDDAVAEKRVREVERLGYKAIFLTVDAVVPGNREKDIKTGLPMVHVDGQGEGDGDTVFGTAGALIVNDDRNMTWEKTIPWLRSVTKLPIDAVLATDAGVDGILLSNHGDGVLYRLRKQRPDIFDRAEVYIDGKLATLHIRALTSGKAG